MYTISTQSEAASVCRAEKHVDQDRKGIRDAGKAADEGADIVVERVIARAEGERLLEHEQESDQRRRGGDEGQDRLRRKPHCLGAGEVRPNAGPHRKCPSSIPTTTAITNA